MTAAKTADEIERRHAAYLPTREQIFAACREIQSGWTDSERHRRAGQSVDQPWTVPEVRRSAL